MPDDGNDNDRESGHKDFWDKLRASGTIVVAVVVAFMGGWFNQQQAERNRISAESQFYTDLLAQRERSDSELRSEMFKTLFDAYFRGKLSASAGPQQTPREEGIEGMVVASGPTPGSSPESAAVAAPDFASLERRIMFLDVLVRNFESIDIRPLFEDLDRRLTEIVWSDGELGEAAAEARQKAFRLRWQLRRAALGNVARQVSALASLDDAKVERLSITEGKCFEGGGDDDPGVKGRLVGDHFHILVTGGEIDHFFALANLHPPLLGRAHQPVVELVPAHNAKHRVGEETK